MRLAIRSRTRGLRATAVERALTEDRSLVVTWLNRGTLHLVTAEDYWWLHPLTAPPQATANRRRLEQEGVSPDDAERGLVLVVNALRERGPQTREQLRQKLDDAGIPTARQALVHILIAASIKGGLVRGPVVNGEQAFVHPRDWLGAPGPELARDDALGRLARRYLEGHGPAEPADLAKWAGLTLGDARKGFAAIASELEDLDGLAFLRGSLPKRRGLPKPRLLGPFDPLLLGWGSREFVTGPHLRVMTTNGIVRPVALVAGRAVGTWGLANGVVTLRLVEPVGNAALDALHRDAADVLRYLEMPPAPMAVLG
jgi:hypothetical protein